MPPSGVLYSYLGGRSKSQHGQSNFKDVVYGSQLIRIRKRNPFKNREKKSCLAVVCFVITIALDQQSPECKVIIWERLNSLLISSLTQTSRCWSYLAVLNIQQGIVYSMKKEAQSLLLVNSLPLSLCSILDVTPSEDFSTTRHYIERSDVSDEDSKLQLRPSIQVTNIKYARYGDRTVNKTE